MPSLPLTRKVRRRALTRSHTHWLLVCSTAGRATQALKSLLALELVHPHGKTGEGTGGSAADSAQASDRQYRLVVSRGMVGIALLTRKEGQTPWLLSAQLLEGRLMCGRSSRALGLVHPHGKTGEGTGGSAADSAQACCGRLRARAVEVGDSGVVAVRARTGARAGRWWCASLDCL